MPTFKCCDCENLVSEEDAGVVEYGPNETDRKVVCAECLEEYPTSQSIAEFAMENSDEVIEEVIVSASIDGEI